MTFAKSSLHWPYRFRLQHRTLQTTNYFYLASNGAARIRCLGTWRDFSARARLHRYARRVYQRQKLTNHFRVASVIKAENTPAHSPKRKHSRCWRWLTYIIAHDPIPLTVRCHLCGGTGCACCTRRAFRFPFGRIGMRFALVEPDPFHIGP